MDDVGCPRCKTTKYRKANIRVLVNVCGHALCDSCIELLFSKGGGPCPECGIPLRRSGFRVRLFEDPVVEKELDIRRRLLKDYCKVESDFESLREYNDYLEELETIVFNLVHNIDIVETNKMIDQYKKTNVEQIAKTRARFNPELLELEALLEEERLLAEHRLFESSALQKDEKLRKQKTKEALIDDLMFSDTDASTILSAHKSQQDKEEQEEMNVVEDMTKRRQEILAETAARLKLIKTQGAVPANTRPLFSTGITVGGSSTGFLPVPKKSEEILFKYVEPEVHNEGPATPSFEHLQTIATYPNARVPFGRLVRYPEDRDKAGGCHVEYQVRRCLGEAFSDIFYNSKTDAAIKCYPLGLGTDDNAGDKGSTRVGY